MHIIMTLGDRPAWSSEQSKTQDCEHINKQKTENCVLFVFFLMSPLYFTDTPK